MTTTRNRGLAGQASVEFVIVGLIFLLVLIGIMVFGLGTFERGNVQRALTSLGSTLPDGWDKMDENELVKELIVSSGLVNPSNLTISDAKVEKTSSGEVDATNDVSRAVGANGARVSSDTVTVSATVTYKYNDVLAAFGASSTTVSVRRSYVVGQSYEMY